MRKIVPASTASALPLAFANATGKAGPRIEPVLAAGVATVNIAKPTSNRGSTTLYPFGDLSAPGQAFGVKNKTAKQLASIVSNQNKKGIVPKKDANGNVIFKTTEMKDANGVVIGQTPTTDPETTVERRYYAVDVTTEIGKTLKGTPLEGSSALVVREI